MVLSAALLKSMHCTCMNKHYVIANSKRYTIFAVNAKKYHFLTKLSL